MGVLLGFQPLFDDRSRLLVLGSFPGVLSRRQAFYYGNSRNRFWQVLSEAFGEPLPVTVPQKQDLCLRHGVALWDIVADCDVTGSADANLRNIRTVDLSPVLGCPLQKILCNGNLAYKLTKGVYCGPLPVIQLPSTSPANVRFDKSKWLQQLN